MIEPKRILVAKLRALGDIMTALPLLRALKERFPAAGITLVVDDLYQDLVSVNPRVDELWLHPAGDLRGRGAWFALKQQADMIRRIRQARFELFIDLYGTTRTAAWGVLGGIPHRLGFALRGRKYFYTQAVVAKHRYVVDLNLQFAELLGWQGQDRSLEFFLAPDDEAAARQQLARQGWTPGRPLLAVSPGGGWPLKQWGAAKFGRVARSLAESTGCQVVLTGSAAETALLEECASQLREPALILAGLPLRQAAAVIREARLFLGNDSGPKYFAEAFGVPTLICYGPTDSVNNNPSTPRTLVATCIQPCQPCHSETCRAGRRACLDDLSEDEVLKLAQSLWRRE
ncbi:MAG: glycosyltransferase family 9 protein [candidate division FCPU426 bacterium]